MGASQQQMAFLYIGVKQPNPPHTDSKQHPLMWSTDNNRRNGPFETISRYKKLVKVPTYIDLPMASH